MTGFITRRLSNFPPVEQELVLREVEGIFGPILFSLGPSFPVGLSLKVLRFRLQEIFIGPR